MGKMDIKTPLSLDQLELEPSGPLLTDLDPAMLQVLSLLTGLRGNARRLLRVDSADRLLVSYTGQEINKEWHEDGTDAAAGVWFDISPGKWLSTFILHTAAEPAELRCLDEEGNIITTLHVPGNTLWTWHVRCFNFQARTPPVADYDHWGTAAAMGEWEIWCWYQE